MSVPIIRRAMLLFFFLLLVFPAILSSQEYETAAEKAVGYQKFPWQDSGELVALDTEDPGQASSLDRASVPKGKRRNTNMPNFTMPGNWVAYFNGILWVLIGLLIALIAGALIWMYLKMEKNTRNSSKFEDYDQEEMIAERIKQLPFELKRNRPGNLSDQARQFAQQGNYSRAMMYLFSHVLLALDKNEFIKLKKGKTNRQYLNEIRRHSDISEYYTLVMIPFEDSFFGNHQISQQRFESCWSKLEGFESQVNQTQQVVTA